MVQISGRTPLRFDRSFGRWSRLDSSLRPAPEMVGFDVDVNDMGMVQKHVKQGQSLALCH